MTPGDIFETTTPTLASNGGYAKPDSSNNNYVDIGSVEKDYPAPAITKYTVTLNTNGGKALKNNKLQVEYGQTFGKLPKPKRKGYIFKGWYTKKSKGTKITSKSKMKYKKNMTLYAHWNKSAKIVKCKIVHFRKGPGVSKKVLGYIKKGKKVEILKKVRNKSGNLWYKVKYGKRTGYVYSKYVKLS